MDTQPSRLNMFHEFSTNSEINIKYGNKKNVLMISKMETITRYVILLHAVIPPSENATGNSPIEISQVCHNTVPSSTEAVLRFKEKTQF